MSWTNIHLPLITPPPLASTMSSTDSASVFAILRLAEDEPEAQPASHAGVGKRKQRPDGLYADCRTYPSPSSPRVWVLRR